MTKPEQAKLARLVDQWITDNHGAPNAVELVSMYPYMIPTRAGALLVHLDGDNLFCRFVDPTAANKLLTYRNRLNPYSGKWNFHFRDWSAHEAIEYMLTEFQYVQA